MAIRTSTSDVPLGLSLALIGLVLVGLVGWVINIVKIVGSLSDPLSAMFIARVVGVFAAPLGAVLGFI